MIVPCKLLLGVLLLVFILTTGPAQDPILRLRYDCIILTEVSFVYPLQCLWFYVFRISIYRVVGWSKKFCLLCVRQLIYVWWGFLVDLSVSTFRWDFSGLPTLLRSVVWLNVQSMNPNWVFYFLLTSIIFVRSFARPCLNPRRTPFFNQNHPT